MWIWWYRVQRGFPLGFLVFPGFSPGFSLWFPEVSWDFPWLPDILPAPRQPSAVEPMDDTGLAAQRRLQDPGARGAFRFGGLVAWWFGGGVVSHLDVSSCVDLHGVKCSRLYYP